MIVLERVDGGKFVLVQDDVVENAANGSNE